MANGYFVLKNKLGQTARSFRWKENKIIVVLRHDTGRVETVPHVALLEKDGISYETLAQSEVSKLKKKPILLGGFGSIEYTEDPSDFSPNVEASREEQDNLKSILRWTAIGHLSVILLIVGAGLLFQKEEIPEPQIVQVFEQRKEEPKKRLTVKMSEKKIVQHKKKVTVKKEARKVEVTVKTPQVKPRSRTAARHVEPTKKMDLNKVGALGVLGAPSPNSNRAGGFDISKISNRRVGGAGGANPTSGSAKLFSGKGLVAASPGTGDKAQTVGGYGTAGKAGGRSGYGQISLVGSGSAFSSPVDSEAVVEGGLDRDQIAAVIRRHIGEVRFCYEKGLQVDADLSGRVAIRFVIGAHGGVNVANVAHSSLRDSKIESCITARLRTWQFPKPVGGVNVKVTYPFVLKRLSQG